VNDELGKGGRKRSWSILRWATIIACVKELKIMKPPHSR